MRSKVWIVCCSMILVAGLSVSARGHEDPMAHLTPAERLLVQGDDAFQSRNYAQAGEIYKLAVQQAEEEEHQHVLVEALAQVARSYLITDRKEEGRSWLERAEKAAAPSVPLGWSRYLGVRGRFEWQDEELEKATATFTEMYNYCLEKELHSRAVDAAHMVAITAPPEEQIVWASKGIWAAEKGNIEEWLGPLWNNLGWTYDDLGRYQESLDALLKAREYHWKLGGELNKLIADWSVGHAYRMIGEYQTAAQWMRPVLAWSERLYAIEQSPDAAEWIGHSCRELGELALQREDLPGALESLRRAREKLQEAGMPEWDADGFAELSRQIEEIAGQVPGQ